MADSELRVEVAGKSFSFTPAESPVSVGSSPESAVLVAEPSVSRHHGRFVYEDSWRYEDAGSTNGSYSDGRRVSSVAVAPSVAVHLAAADGPQLNATAGAPTTASLGITVGGRTITVEPPGPVILGRDPGVDVVVDDALVSRRHLRILVEEGTWTVVDTSRNGVFHNGGRVDRLTIAGSAHINLGAADGVAVELGPPRPRASTEAVRPGGALSVAVEARSSLLIGDLKEASQVFRPRTTTVRIGRAPDNDIVVDDVIVSRHHAELRGSADTGYELADLGSFNGTYLNGRITSRAKVVEGDILSVGRSKFLLRGGALEEYVDSGNVSFEAKGLTVETPHGLVILDDVSFALAERSLMAVVGPSGSGKSTLLNALTGFRPAQRGAVLYDGRDLYATYDDLRHRIGYVPQDDILHTQLTVHRAIDYAARLRFPPDVAAHVRRVRVDEVIEELGLTHRANVPIRNLSGGQRKRASVAIELLTRPSLLFLDEPTSGLDPGYERALTQMLRDLADGGRTIVVVTHSVQSLDLCDRMVVLAPGGTLAFYGPPDEAAGYFERDNYADIFRTLEHEPAADWKARYAGHSAFERYVAGPLASREWEDLPHPEDVEPVARRGWLRQFATLVRRNLAVIGSDRRLLWTMLLQAPILGAVMLAALPPREFRPLSDIEFIRFSQATMVLAVLVVGVTALGLSNAIREIVKELPIYRRERAVGLAPSAYVASKAVVLGLLTALQSAILVLIAIRTQGEGWGAAFFESDFGPLSAGEVELVIGMVLAGVGAMALGLLISAGARTVDRAATLLPMLLVAELLLSGAFKPVIDEAGGRELSWFASANWGFSTGAATVDLNTLQAFNDCLAQDTKVNNLEDVEFLLDCLVTPRTIEPITAILEEGGLDPAVADLFADELRTTELAGEPPPIPEPPLRFWDQERGDWTAGVGFEAAYIVVSLVGAWALLRLRDRRLMDTR